MEGVSQKDMMKSKLISSNGPTEYKILKHERKYYYVFQFYLPAYQYQKPQDFGADGGSQNREDALSYSMALNPVEKVITRSEPVC